MTRKRVTDTRVRKQQILDECMKFAVKYGYHNITRDMIGKRVDMTGAGVSYLFGTMANLERDMVRYAIHTENIKVLAQMVALNNKYVRRKLSDDLKSRITAHISNFK